MKRFVKKYEYVICGSQCIIGYNLKRNIFSLTVTMYNFKSFI